MMNGATHQVSNQQFLGSREIPGQCFGGSGPNGNNTQVQIPFTVESKYFLNTFPLFVRKECVHTVDP